MLLRALDCLLDTFSERFFRTSGLFETFVDDSTRFTKTLFCHAPPFIHDRRETGITNGVGTGFEFGEEAFH